MRESAAWRPYLYVLATSFILLVFDKTALLDPFKSPLQSAALPVQQTMGDAITGLYRTMYSLYAMWHREKEYESLRVAYNQLLASHARNLAFKEENQKLYSQLGSPISRKHKLLPTRLVSRYPIISIDRGAVDTVKPGMAVVSGDVLIGRIAQVGPVTATIMVSTGSDSRIMAQSSASHVKGILVGSFGAGMLMTKMLQGARVNADELILSSGEDGLIPGLAIGKITNVYSKPSDLFQEADVTPLVALSQLDIVFIVLE